MSLIHELQQRNVFRVGAAYLALSWLVIQVVDTLGSDFGLPDGSLRVITIVVAIAFLPVMIFTWSFDLTSEGIKRDRDVDRSAPGTIKAARRLDRVVIVLLALAVGYFAYDKFLLAPEREAEIAAEAREEGRTAGLIEMYREESIAVLPFRDMSEAGDQQAFAEGIAEELLNLLARIKGLRVTSRTSSFQLAQEGLDVREIARRLDVRYVLEGSVRKAGDTVRITAQLIEAGIDTHKWSENYDRKFEDIFAIQDEIAAYVVEQTKATILGEMPHAGAISEEAYALYLQGLPLLAARNEEGLRRAEAIFQQVIAMEPGYAPVHASYAAAMFWQGSANDRSAEVMAAAQKALDLDPDNADALAMLGRKHDDIGQPLQAAALLRRAIDVNPSHPNAWRWLGTLYSGTDPDAYLRYARRAFALNPTELTIAYHTGLALALLGRTDEALHELELMTGGEAAGPAVDMARQIHEMSGRLDLALKSNYRFQRDFGFNPENIRLMVFLGAEDVAQTWVDVVRAMRDAPAEPVATMTAYLSLRHGDREKAVQTMAAAAANGTFAPHESAPGLMLVELGGDPAPAIAIFERLVEKPGQYEREYLRYRWRDYLSYGIALHRAGEVAAAESIFDDVVPVVEALIAKKMYIDQFAFRLHELLAAVHATRGDDDKAIDALNQGLDESWLCPSCLRDLSYFQSLQDIPEFQQVLGRADAWAAEQRKRLAGEGMLLTYEELLALENFEFDPFNP